MSTLQSLRAILTLEPIEVNLFRGFTPAQAAGDFRIYGGQVIAQALIAAYKTIEGRLCHSLQAYFIRPGDPKAPVLYEVERSRDGKSFATRRVIAIQHGEQILNLAASFQIPEPGFEHQSAAPEGGRPLDAPSDIERIRARADQIPAALLKRLEDHSFPIEMRRIDPADPLNPGHLPPHQLGWFRAVEDLGDDPALNQAALAYASDASLLSTCARPHGVSWMNGVQMASLDHALWFHRPSRADQWHLYAQDSPSASGARGFNRGSIFTEDGVLVASVAQEGLIRPRA
jgi:acyl-CoA thioesterase-2